LAKEEEKGERAIYAIETGFTDDRKMNRVEKRVLGNGQQTT